MYPKANKNLGQHFLVDKHVINKITSNYAQEADVIIEVGPGPGVLTKDLSQLGKPFYAIELDKRFKENLDQYLDSDHLILRDALHFEWSELLQKKDFAGKKIWLVSNLPYQVSSQLFILFLQLAPITYITLMFQKEVAEKIHPPENKKNSMSSLNVLGRNYFELKALVKAPPGCFRPQPKVDSLVLTGKRVEKPHISFDNFDHFENFVRFLFSKKRKQIGGVLKGRYPNALKALEDLDISSNLRAEALDHDKVIKLFEYLEDH